MSLFARNNHVLNLYKIDFIFIQRQIFLSGFGVYAAVVAKINSRLQREKFFVRTTGREINYFEM